MRQAFAAVAAITAAILTIQPSAAGNWYFGFGYDFSAGQSATVGTSSYAKTTPIGGEVRLGWEWFKDLAFEGRYSIGFGSDGDVHTKRQAASFGVLASIPKVLPESVFLTAGVVHLAPTSNLMVTTTHTEGTPPAPVTVVTFTRYPDHTFTTWYVGAAWRLCERVFCPRIDLGYQGSDAGGLYAGAGMDFRLP